MRKEVSLDYGCVSKNNQGSLMSLKPPRVLSSQQVAEYPSKRCLEAGLLINTGRRTKDDASESDDIRMMETS